MRYAELKPEIPAYRFPAPVARPQQQQQQRTALLSPVTLVDDEFGADEFDDQDMADAGQFHPEMDL